MKLRVGLTLRRCLLMAMVASAVTVGTHGAYGGVLHSDVSMQTYTDFGQNNGRYAVGGKVNALLEEIRNREGGITVSYTDGQSDRVVISNTQGMINFSGTHDGGHSAAIGANYLATVRHNGALDASFGERTLGSQYAINYDGIDIRHSVDANGDDCFRLTPNGYDYMLQRQSKIITDATWNTLYTLPEGATEKDAISGLVGQHLYHSGAGTMQKYHEPSGSLDYLQDPYQYITGAVVEITNAYVHDWSSDNANSIITNADEGNIISGADNENPLPWGCRGGDSGSPTYIYNETTGQYEYIAAVQSSFEGKSSWTQSRGAVSWTQDTMESFNRRVSMSGNTVYLNAITKAGETISDTSGHSTTIHTGDVTNELGETVVSYNGIVSGEHTWKNLMGIRDTDNWYANSGYLNQSDADLFHNSNLVFTAESGTANQIVLNDTVDLGVGYAEFSGGKFTISSEGAENNQFNHAGYVINKGAEVHLQLSNPADYMFEWRKIGEGALYIEGAGDTNALLNVGGTGTTYLNRTDGYAAYNVLANSGATVQITGGVNQIKRDFTFGSGGGKLDMAGHSMEWNNSHDASAEGFTIHALTEEAIITNSTGSTTLTVTDSATSVDGSSVFLGSFQDSAEGALKVKYDGGDGSTWTLHSIHTDLSKNAGSGFEVDSGTVVLAGTLTKHGLGSDSGYDKDRYVNKNDWHYADAKMDVTVNKNGSFELGSHARLDGDVTVNDNGSFVMHQGVNHQYEHMEGGANKQDTYAYADYYGLKGNVSLNGENTSMKVQLGKTGEAVDSVTTYAGAISGNGSLTVDAATKKTTLVLTGDNSGHTGTKALLGGTLKASGMAALGDVTTNKWVVEQGATFVMSEGISFDAIDDSKTGGVIALTQNSDTQLGVNSVIGAYEGHTVQYGTFGTSTELTATADGKWHLGGGGGTLVVNFLLAGDNKLVLGDGTSEGEVKLTNINNTFSGGIETTDGVFLSYDDARVLGTGQVSLAYRSSMDSQGSLSGIASASSGSFYIDHAVDTDLDLTNHTKLSIAAGADATYTGNITVANGADYRFGGGAGVLTIDTVLSGAHGLEIDAHTQAGNKVILNKATTLTGAVYVCGYNSLMTSVHEGDMTLQLNVDEAFASSSKVNIIDNGVLDINGTTQTLTSFRLDADGAIIDSSADFSGHVILSGNNSSSNRLAGTVTVGNVTLNVASGLYSMETLGAITTDTLTKTGDGKLSLRKNSDNPATTGDHHSYRNLHILGGLVTYENKDLTLDSVTIGGGKLLITDNKSLNAQTTLTNGGTLELGNASIRGDLNVKASDAEVDGYLHTKTAAGIYLRNGLDVEKDAVLRVTAEDAGNNSLVIDASQTKSLNASGGTIQIDNKWVSLEGLRDGETQTIGGTIEGTGSAGLVFSAAEQGITSTRVFDTVDMTSGKTLSLRSANNSNTTWQFSNLKGGSVGILTPAGFNGTSKLKISPASGTEQSQVTSNITGGLSVEIAGNAKITGANTYTGGTKVTAGTVTTASQSAFGSGAVDLGANKLVLESNLNVGGAMKAHGASIDMGGHTLSLSAAGNSMAEMDFANGKVSVGIGAGLSLSGMITMSDAYFEMGSGSSLSVAEKTIFFLDINDFGDDKSLTLSSGSAADSFTGSLSSANFVISDISANQYEGFSVSQTGTHIVLTYTGVPTNTYVWNSTTGIWSASDESWLKPSEDGSSSVAYANGGNVTFGNTGSGGTSYITVAEGIAAANMTVDGKYSFNGADFSVANNLMVKKGASASFWNISPDVKGNVIIEDGATMTFDSMKAGRVSGSITVDGDGKLELVSSDVSIEGDNNKLGNVELSLSTLSLKHASTIGNLKLIGGGESTLTDNSGSGVTVENLVILGKSSDSSAAIALKSNLATVSGMKLTGATITNDTKQDLVMGSTISGTGSISATNLEFLSGAEATLTSGSSLKLTTTGKVVASGGKMTLESGAVLDMTGTGLNDGKKGGVHDGNITNILNSVQGAGTLKLATTGDTTPAELTGSADVHTHVEVDGMLNLNAWKTDNGAVVTLHDDASLTTKGELRVQSKAVVDVNGGALEAQGGIKLGHSTAQNTGTLKLTDGTVTTTSIGAVAAHANNKLIMNGGTLEFTQNETSAIGAGITTELNGGTLKAEQSSWFVDRAMTLGGVTVDVAAEKEISFKGGLTNTANTTMKVTGEGALVLSGANSAINGTLQVSDSSTLRLSGAGLSLSTKTHALSKLDVMGTSTLSGGSGAIAQASALTADAGAKLTVSGGMSLDVQQVAAAGAELQVSDNAKVKATGETHAIGTANITNGGNLELHGKVAMTNLNMAGAATVSGDAAVTAQFAELGNNTQATISGVKLTLTEGATNIQGASTVKLTGNAALNLTDAEQKNGVTIASHNGNDATLTNLACFSRSGTTVSMGGDAASRARIDHAYIDVLSGSVLNLSYVTVSDTSYITDVAATMNVNDVQLDVTVGTNAEALVSSIPSEGLELRQMGGDITSTVSAPGDATVLAITSGIMDTVTVTGSTLTINLSNVENWDSYDYLSLQFKNQDKLATTFANTLIVNIVCNEQVLLGPAYYAVTRSFDASGALVDTIYIRTSDDAVPEPTTATLSLLGLAGLMLRRRRK